MSHNTWIHRIAHVTLSKPLSKTPVTPNMLTTVRLGLGLGAVVAVAMGTAEATMIGAWLFLVSMLFDRADGDLARITGKTSPYGHKYDLGADASCNSLIFVGLGIGLTGSDYGLGAIAMGVLAGAAVATIFTMVIRIEAMQGARAAEIGNFAGFDPDDAMIFVPIAMLLGWSEGLLLAAAIGAPGFALFFIWLFRAKLRETQPVA